MDVLAHGQARRGKGYNPVHRESAYRIASTSVLFWLTSASFSRSQSSKAWT